MNRIILLALLLWVAILPAQEWKLTKDNDNIEVYTRKIDGQAIKDLRINTVLNTTLSELVAALEDFSLNQSWVRNTIFSKKVEAISDTHFYFHTATDLPFPAKNRDVVIRYERQQDPITNVVRIDYEGYPDKVAKDPDYVRIPVLTAYYILTPVSPGEINVEYFLRTEIGGSIPNWIINLGISVGPTDTMKALRKVLATGRYADSSVPELNDPFN